MIGIDIPIPGNQPWLMSRNFCRLRDISHSWLSSGNGVSGYVILQTKLNKKTKNNNIELKKLNPFFKLLM